MQRSLKRAALLVLLGVSAVARAGAQVPTQTESTSSGAQVVTSAVGEARYVPDRAAVYAGVQTRASTAAIAGRQNAARQKAVIDAIVAAGVPRDQIRTQNYSVYPETRYDNTTQQSTVTGYVVSNVVRVELRDTDRVGAVIDAALGKGANQINSLEFFASDADSSHRAALADAVSRARRDAEAMATAVGGKLGPLLELNGTNDMGPRPVMRMEADAMMARKTVPTPIEVGEQTVRARVTARWRIITP